MSAEFDLEQLDDFFNRLNKVNDPYMQKRVKRFLTNEGNKLKKETISIAQTKVKERTGRYLKGIKRGRVYKYKNETWAVRAYNSQPHAHLIENNKRIVTKGGVEKGIRKGTKVFATAEKNFTEPYIKDADKFIDRILKEGLGF